MTEPPQDGPADQSTPPDDGGGRRRVGISSGTLGDVIDAQGFAETIVDTIREGLLVLDSHLRVVAANESFYRTFRVAAEETVGRLVYDLGNGQWDVPELRELLESVLAHKGAFDGYEVDHEFEGVGRRVVVLNARRFHDHLILLAIEDATERRHTEAALHEREGQFGVVADLVPDLLWRADPRGGRTWANRRWTEYTGQSAEEAAGFGWVEAVHPDDRTRAVDEATGAAGAFRSGNPFQAEHRVRGADGAYRWFLVNAAPLRDEDGRVTEWVGSSTDVHAQRTARETLEAEVDARTAQVRALARALTLAEQAERRRLAEVLHDGLQQILHGAQIHLSIGDVERAEALLDEAIQTARSLSHELAPPVLEGRDISELFEWLAERKRLLYGLEVDFDGGGVSVPGEGVGVLLYRVLRELLFNVSKHAGTGRVRVWAEPCVGCVRVVVEDDGRGFDPSQPPGLSGTGLGLASVRERLEAVGGRVAVASAPGAGTKVTVEVPSGE